MKTKPERIQILKSRLQFSVVLASFFPVVIEAIFSASDMSADRIILLWGFVVALLISSYIFVEIARGNIHTVILRYVNNMVLLNTASYVPVMFISAVVQGEYTSPVNDMLFQISVLGILAVPVIIVTLLICNIVLTVFKIQQEQ